MPQQQTEAARPFCLRFGGALSLPLVALGTIVLCFAAALALVGLNDVLTRFHLKPSAHDEIYAFTLVCDFLALWLLMAPVFAYLNVGQTKKVELICGFYTADLITEYFDQFWSGRDSIADLVYRWRHRQPAQRDALERELDARFRSVIVEDFGGSIYIVPALILVAIGFLVLFFGFAGGIGYAESLVTGSTSPVMPLGLRLDLVSVAAIFGAYTWVASDSITRAHQWTFHPSDLAWYALRLLIAVPLGHAISQAFTPAAGASTASLGAFLAFVLSMFSLDSIKKTLAAAAARLGGVQSAMPEERDDVVIKLAGVDQSAADALRAEGIGTIAQLTAVDPVRTSILTGLPFEYVLGLIDSAILWTFFRNKTDQLREFGLRGASGLLLHSDWLSQSALAGVAGELVNAEAVLHDRQMRVDRATAARDAARDAVGPDPITLDEAERALQAIIAQPDQQAAAERRRQIETKIAALRNLKDCEDTLASATADRDTAIQTARGAATQVRAAAATDALFTAIEAKTGLSVVGLDEATAQLRVDTYARFICRLLAPS